ncbi:hypothetical protein [Seleniivibrio sp.]|uniref:hypothetical protein n=1 Tax=Seleniivibrio sp. TaxID=2898801 RepID=UPI0025E0563D|nr:hypothetical protein [Seleniivibrio sp.]MCD8552386.1 hypothetical protein [Seleniivibrio sp.]
MISFTTVAVFEFVHVLVFILLGDVLFMNEPRMRLAYYIVMGVYIIVLGTLSLLNRGDEPELCALDSIAKLDRFLFDFSKDNTTAYVGIYLVLFGSCLFIGKLVIKSVGFYFPA